jgi:hypothetical protein
LDEIEFVPDHDARGPAPLDPAIANVWLRSISNRYVDGFDLEVSANFGAETVLLEGGGQTLQVEMAVKRAIIELHFKNCRPTPLLTDNGSNTYLYSETTEDVNEAKRETLSKIGGRVRASPLDIPNSPGQAGGGLSGSASRSNNVSKSVTRKATWTRDAEWLRSGPTTLLVGDGERKLSGQPVANFRGWRVEITEISESYSIVMASLTTRAEWLHFGRVKVEGIRSQLASKIKGILQAKKSRDKELFFLLLKTLAANGLHSRTNREATLAAHVQVLRRVDIPDGFINGLPLTLPPAAPRCSIDIEMNILEHFLDLPSSQKVSFVEQQGAPAEELHRIARQYEDSTSRRNFFAGTPPPTALEALKFSLGKRVRILEWDSHNREKAREDLVALGLLDIVDGFVVCKVQQGISPEDALRHAAVRAPALLATREILSANPRATGVEIGEEIARRFNRRTTTTTSKLKAGQKLRRWALWLEPHLLDPAGGSFATRLRISATSRRPGRGAPSHATPETIARLQKAIDEGLRGKAAAKAAGISNSTLYYWEARGLVNIPNKIKRKPRKSKV